MNYPGKKQGQFFCLLSCMLSLLLCGCSLIPHIGHHTPSQSEQRLVVPFQPYRVEQYCINTPPIFPASLFRQATNALADRVGSLITSNMGGLAVYVNLITHDSLQNNVLRLKVPAFPADPAPPPSPTLGDDPYQNSDVWHADQQAYDRWQAQLRAQHNKLDRLRNQVKQWTDQLRSLNPARFYDPISDDLNGCLVDASQHVQHVNGDTFLILSTPLVNNTLFNASRSINLAGAPVIVIFRTCIPVVASVCAASDAYWIHLFMQQYRAKSVKVLDPAQSEIEKPTF